MSTPREYEIVVFGASGYTGMLTAEYIAAKLQTNLRWAIAGRSRAKLDTIAAELKASNPDRVQPGELRMQLQFYSTLFSLSIMQVNVSVALIHLSSFAPYQAPLPS